MVRENLEKGVAAAEELAKGIEQAAAVESLRDFNVKLIEMTQANATAAFEFARQISTAKGPSEAIELWSSQARKQFETLTTSLRSWQRLARRSRQSAPNQWHVAVAKR